MNQTILNKQEEYMAEAAAEGKSREPSFLYDEFVDLFIRSSVT